MVRPYLLVGAMLALNGAAQQPEKFFDTWFYTRLGVPDVMVRPQEFTETRCEPGKGYARCMGISNHVIKGTLESAPERMRLRIMELGDPRQPRPVMETVVESVNLVKSVRLGHGNELENAVYTLVVERNPGNPNGCDVKGYDLNGKQVSMLDQNCAVALATPSNSVGFYRFPPAKQALPDSSKK